MNPEDDTSLSQQAKRVRKKPNRLAEVSGDDDSNNRSSIAEVPVKIPEFKWSRFPQSELKSGTLTRKGKYFNGEYLLKDDLPDNFDADAYYLEQKAKRWSICCCSNQKAKKDTEPLPNPFKIAGRTSMTLVSSLWVSKCGRFHLYPHPGFAFLESDEDNEAFWMADSNFVEYHCIPKSTNSSMFLHPTDWETALTKLELAVKEHRDVSSSDADATKTRKKCNKNSPVKLEAILVPLREREKAEAKKEKARKSAEASAEKKKLAKAAAEKKKLDEDVEKKKMAEKIADEEAKLAKAAAEKKKADEDDVEKKKKAEKIADEEAKLVKAAAEKKKADEEAMNKVPAISKVVPLIPAKKLTEPVSKSVFPLGPPPSAAASKSTTEAYVRAVVLAEPPPTIADGKYFKIPNHHYFKITFVHYSASVFHSCCCTFCSRRDRHQAAGEESNRKSRRTRRAKDRKCC
jgi:hypothetical protein